jgi:pimeloyl-ACP methyl ester carboxylesterase
VQTLNTKRDAAARHGVALFVGVPAIPLVLAAWTVALCMSLSLWGLAYLSAFTLFALGCLTAPWRRTRWRGLVRASLAALVLIVVAKVVAATSDATIRVTALPGDRGTRWMNTLVVERDGTLPAAALLHAFGQLRDVESAELAPALSAAYERMGSSANAATPAVATHLGFQRMTLFDAIVIEPAYARAKGAVIFLHGYSGNFVVYCWEIAEASRRAGLLTVCPSMRAQGDWWSPRGAETVQATLEFVRAKGLRRMVLVGLSNGAAGASVIAAARPDDFAALVLISGTRADAPPAVPVLVVQGARDTMMPTAAVRAYAARGGSGVRYVELDGGHFVFLTRWQQMRTTLGDFFIAVSR